MCGAYKSRNEAFMAKKASQKIVSKKHLARQEREQRQTRIVTAIAIGVVALVILGISYGILNNTLFLRWRPAVTVNGETLSLHEFQVRVRAQRTMLINQYMQYNQFAQMFGMDPSQDPQMSQTMDNITSQLDSTSTIGSQVIDDMVNNLLIRQYAKAHSIVVTKDEVDKAMQSALGYFPNGTPSPTLTVTAPAYSTPNPTQLFLETPTLSPTVAPTNTSRPTWTPNLSATPTLVPSLTPTATPYTLKGYQEQLSNVMKNYAPAGMNEDEFRRIYYEDALYSDKVKAAVTTDVSHEQEMVWARHILVADESKAKSVYNQLKIGADFGVLASMYSIDTTTKDKGGDLGWFTKGKMVPDFEAGVWSMKVGAINPPIKTTYGYHLVQVLGHEVRPLNETEYNDAVTKTFSDFLLAQRNQSKVVINDAWSNFVPTDPTLAQAQADYGFTITSYIKTNSRPTATPTK